MEATYSFTCLAEASLMGALLLPTVGKKKVNWEPRPTSEHQICVDYTQLLQNGWHYRHALFQPNEMASQLSYLLLAS